MSNWDGKSRFGAVLPPAQEPLGPYTAPYSEEAIKECREAALSDRREYLYTVHAICEVEGYNFRAFRRWLHRNGVRTKKQYTPRWPKGYTQIVINLSAEEKEIVDSVRGMSSGEDVSRTEFVRRAVVHYIDYLKKKGKVKV